MALARAICLLSIAPRHHRLACLRGTTPRLRRRPRGLVGEYARRGACRLTSRRAWLAGGLARGSQVDALRVVVHAVYPIGHARGQASGEVVVPQIEVGIGGQRAVGRRDRAWE
jgi:hypothetical protein